MTNLTEQEVRLAFELGTNTISAETAEKFRRQMEVRGLNPDAALAQHGHGVGSRLAADPSQATPKPAQRLAVDIDPVKLPRLSAEQTAKAAETLRKFWTGDPAVLEAALNNAGAAPVALAAPDTRTEEEREFDNSSLAAPVDPASYDLNGLWLGREADLSQLPERDRTIRSTMSELSVPAALGRATAEAFADSASEWSRLAGRGEVAIKQFHLEQSALFARVTKMGWQEAASQMKPWLAKMSEGTREFLRASGSLESAPARVRLWQAFQLVRERAKIGAGDRR
jgi:hypothetical protein